MRLRSSLFLVSLVLLSCLVQIGHCSIATSEPPTLMFLKDNSEIIVTGICTNVNIQMSYTNYSFRTYEIIKGSIEDQFYIETEEGTNRHRSPSPVRFEQGQEVILFLNQRDGEYRVYWGPWGKRLLNAEKEENIDYLRKLSTITDLGGVGLMNNSGEVHPVIENESRRSPFGGIGEVVRFMIDPLWGDSLIRDLPLFIFITGLIYVVVFRKE